MKLDEIGIWSEIKLDIIKEYASAFTTIMRKQDWCPGYAYIDAFAGAGVHISRLTGEFVLGSPLNALEIKNPFTEYYYIDIDREKTEALEMLTRDIPNIRIYEEDKQMDLFGDTYRIKVVNSNIKLEEWFRAERLEKAAGFKFVPEPILMRNSKGGPLFFFFFASHNEIGKKIVGDIFNKYKQYL